MSSMEPPLDTEAVSTPQEEASFEDVLRQFEAGQQAQAAEQSVHDGVVVSASAEAIVVDIGRKNEGILTPGAGGTPAGLKAGDRVRVSITGTTGDGYYLLSTFRVEQPKDFSALVAAFEGKLVVAGTVSELVKGGLRVDLGVPAFLPASRSGIREMAELESLVGQQIRCRITKLDVSNPERPDVVVDRRVVLEEEAAVARQAAFEQFSEGMVVTGKVRSLTEFGAFVEIVPGVDGLLHVTDLSWQRVEKPASVLSVGQPIEVKILKINRDNRKISLGHKQLTPDPWSQVIDSLKVGDRVRGKVSRLADFGAFVELAPGVDGLIHLSELSWTRRVRHPGDVLQQGEEVEAVVLAIQASDKRISLGLKQVIGNPWDDAATRFPVGSVVAGPVTSLAQFGAFISLGDGIDGMIHIADITREKKLQHPKEVLSNGQVVKAQVLEVDVPKRRIRLGMKQLEPTSADLYIQEHQAGDVVTGRVVDTSRNEARVELAEGVHGRCRLAAEAAQAAPSSAGGDIDDWTALLNQRWKGGGPAIAESKSSLRPGQVRRFRIAAIEPEHKQISLELAD